MTAAVAAEPEGPDTGDRYESVIVIRSHFRRVTKMNKQTLIWTLVVAVPVGLAALAAGLYFRDTGKLPFQDTPAPVAAPAATGDSTETAGTASAPSATNTEQDQTVDAGPEDQPATEMAVKGPSFDVVGVEPTGETVVAGRSDAGAIVALTANGEVVGKSIANEAGEWTIILDEPLKPGDYDVGLEVHDEKGTSLEQSEQRLAVSVPESGNEQPLVVLNTPDGPSDILQKPEPAQQVAEAPAASTDKPAADGAQQKAETQQPASTTETKPDETIVAAVSDQPANGKPVAD